MVERAVPGHERAAVAGPVDEPVDRLAVGGDIGEADLAVVVLARLGLRDGLGATVGIVLLWVKVVTDSVRRRRES